VNTAAPQSSAEPFSQLQNQALEALSVVADMNHRVLEGLVGLSAATARESLRAYAELQTATVNAMRATQPPQAADVFSTIRTNPFAWYQKGLMTLIEGTHQACRLVEANAQVVTRSAERVQASAEQAAREIQETLTASVNRLKELCGRD